MTSLGWMSERKMCHVIISPKRHTLCEMMSGAALYLCWCKTCEWICSACSALAALYLPLCAFLVAWAILRLIIFLGKWLLFLHGSKSSARTGVTFLERDRACAIEKVMSWVCNSRRSQILAFYSSDLHRARALRFFPLWVALEITGQNKLSVTESSVL